MTSMLIVLLGLASILASEARSPKHFGKGGGSFPFPRPGCNPNTIADDIFAARQSYVDVWENEGATALSAALFTDDGVIMTPGQDTYTGQAELVEYFSRIPVSQASFLAGRAENVVCLGPRSAAEYGVYNDETPVLRVINIWRKEGDQWRVAVNMDTNDLGAPATTAAP